MANTAVLNRAAAKENPAEFFDTPQDLSDNVLMTSGEKVIALQRWRFLLEAELRATSEGMQEAVDPASQLECLEAIDTAIMRLQATVPEPTD